MAIQSSEPHEVLYVRVHPRDKARLRALADRRFNGSMAKAIRWLVDAYVDTGKDYRNVRGDAGH